MARLFFYFGDLPRCLAALALAPRQVLVIGPVTVAHARDVVSFQRYPGTFSRAKIC